MFRIDEVTHAVINTASGRAGYFPGSGTFTGPGGTFAHLTIAALLTASMVVLAIAGRMA